MSMGPLVAFAYMVPSATSVPLWLSRARCKVRLWVFSMLLTGFSFGGMFALRHRSPRWPRTITTVFCRRQPTTWLLTMPDSRRYRTSLGRWGAYVLLGQFGVAMATVGFWRVGAWPMVVLGAVVLCLAAWTLLGTRYVIGDVVLDVRRGPFRLRVPLRDITAVHRHAVDRGVTFGFGPDFIGIEYGANAVNVSPRDADDFIRAVQAAVPARVPPRTIGRDRAAPQRANP